MSRESVIDELITRVFAREGTTYENVKHDRGGPTKYGITLGRLRTERGRHMTWQDVRDLTADEAREIYKDAYFRRPRIGELPEEIIEFVFDTYVTSGTWAVTILQQTLRDAGFDLSIDGVIGAQTIEAAEIAQRDMQHDLLLALIVGRTHFFGRIYANDARQGKFIRGWVNQRAYKFWTAAVAAMRREAVA